MATQIQQPRPTSTGQAKPTGGVGVPVSPAWTKRPGWGRGVTWARKTLKGQFVTQVMLLLVIAVVLGVVAQSAFSQAHDDLNTIVVESAPSVGAALEMGLYIQDIDAKAADFLAASGLTALVPCALPVTKEPSSNLTVHDCDSLTIDYDITVFNEALYNAAHNVTFPGEQTAVARITTGFEEYVSDITVMRQEYALAGNKNSIQDEHMKRARQAYASANNVLRQHMSASSELDAQGLHITGEKNVPACVIDDQLGKQTLSASQWPNEGLEVNVDCLSSINKAHLDAAYENAQNALTGLLTLLIALSLVLCVFLVITTFRMLLVTHRIMNPGLTLALLMSVTLSTLLLSNYSGLGGRHGGFGEIVLDDYHSVYYAATMNRYATSANADESRWLIALQGGDQTQVDRWAEDWQQNKQRVEGLIAQARQNRTWSEEDEPLAAMQQAWTSYTTIDGQIRSKAQDMGDPQRINDAEQISAGVSNQTFGTFTRAVERLSAANQGHLNSTYNAVTSMTAMDAMLAIVLLPIIGLLAVWGVWLRLKDF